MAISVDRVYQTVQRLLNIEQRGQLPPADFNYFANLAQLDLFNDLFTNKTFYERRALPEPLDDMTQERIDVFIVNVNLTNLAEGETRFSLPDELYMLDDVYYDGGTRRVIVEQLDHKGSRFVLNSSLTAPTTLFPKYERYNSSTSKGIGEIQVFPGTITSSVNVDYIKRPEQPIWGFQNIGGTALYTDTNSTDFDLHISQEEDLIEKILYYSALSIKQEDISQLANQEVQQDEQFSKTL